MKEYHEKNFTFFFLCLRVLVAKLLRSLYFIFRIHNPRAKRIPPTASPNIRLKSFISTESLRLYDKSGSMPCPSRTKEVVKSTEKTHIHKGAQATRRRTEQGGQDILSPGSAFNNFRHAPFAGGLDKIHHQPAVEEPVHQVAQGAAENGRHGRAPHHEFGPGGPVEPTGNSVVSEYVYNMEFDGDRIRHMTKIWNDTICLQQLGWA